MDCEAQWVQTGGPEGAALNSIVSSGIYTYAATELGGIYKSSNYGINWIPINNGLTNFNVQALAVSDTYIFAGTYGAGVFKSTNNGINWTLSNNNLSSSYIISLGINGSYVYAGGYQSGIYVSSNNGANWSHENNFPSSGVYSIAFNGNNVFAASYNEGVYLSTNNGVNWVQRGLSSRYISKLITNGSFLFAATSTGIFRSSDNGITWFEINNGLINSDVETMSLISSNLFAGTWGGLFRSTNNGNSWFSINGGLPNNKIFQLGTNGIHLFAGIGSLGGIYSSSNYGSSWIESNSGLKNQFINTLANNSNYLYSGTDYGLFRTSNNGDNWIPANIGLSNLEILSLISNETHIFAGTNGAGVYSSTNNGNTWSQTTLNNYSVGSLLIKNNLIFAASKQNGVFISSNNGINWVSSNNGLTNLNCNSITFNSTNIFLGTLGGVFTSTNNGSNWSAINNGLTNLNVYAISYSGAMLFAGTYLGGIFRSANNGMNWIAVNIGLTDTRITSLISTGSNLIAGTGDGYYGSIFLSTNYGDNWSSINQGFTVSSTVYSFLINNSYIFAGTSGQSVWKRPLSDFIPLQAPTNLAYDTINNRLVWTFSLSYNVANYLVYKKGSDNIWKSIADSGGMLNSNANFYNIQTSGFNYYKVAAISNSGDTARSDSIYINRGYVLKKWNAGIIEPYKIRKHSFSFGNTTSNMWPSSVYSHYNNYSDPPYPRELFMKKRGPFWVTKIHSRAFSDWNLFTDIFGNENCYLHHGSNPPQIDDVFNKKAVDIWYSSLRNNRFYDGLISDFPGVCVGFSIASALSFSKNTSFNNQFPVMSNVDSVFGLTLSGGNGNDIRKVINHLGAINHVIRMPSILQSTSPRVVLSQIVDSLSVIRSLNNHYNIALGLADDKAFVHAVFPYAVERDPLDNNIFYIYIYDSNRPGNERKRILVNTNTDKCSYENYNQNILALYAEIDKYLGIQKLPGIDRLEFNNSKTESIFTTLFTSIKNSVFIIDPLTTDTIAGYRNSDSTLFGNPGRVLIPMTDGRFNIPQSYSIPLQNTNIFMKDFVSDSSGIFFSYFADTNTFIRYERYDSISSDQTDIIRIVNGSLSMYNPDALIKKISLTSIISSNSTINIQKTFEVNNFGLNYHDSVSSIIIDSSKMKLKNYGHQSSYNLSLIYSDSSTFKYFNSLNIIIPENSSHIVSPVWDSITAQPIQIYVDIGNNGTIDDTIRVNNIITNSEEGFVSLPDKYSLAQNYPNPFNPSTLIKYDIKQDGWVTVKVYTILGKEVATLVNEVKQAGRYEVEFNGSYLSSGIYYYRLEAGDFSETKKMLLLK